ncbi:flavin reductase family protein [Microbacterium sp. YY-01]|uniref:flavin reductase family protein n=1 Tax=Microbacterium sp. YY-01 TaxID=3421634 RepID=UPI003D16FABD
MTEPSDQQEAEETLDAKFKAAFRHHPAGVALVTAQTPRGPVGLTLSSVASVSADPAVLVFSVTRATGSAGGVLHAPSMLVHFLNHDQAELAEAFARTGAPRFTPEQQWQELPTGEPYLASARAALRCRIRQTVAVGGSALILADVLDVLPGRVSDALLYHDRRFDRLASAVETQ